MSDFVAYLTEINFSKKNIMRDPNNIDPAIVTDYSPYMIAKCLSYAKDAVLLLNEINAFPDLDGQLHFEFLLHVLPKRKRFNKTHRVPKIDLDLIKRYYNYGDTKALEVLDLHTEADLGRIRDHFAEGGVLEQISTI